MPKPNLRRTALKSFGIAAGAAMFAGSATAANNVETPLMPAGASDIRNLTARLDVAPRRRNFKTVPMILNSPEQWDHEALSEVIAYRGERRQVWDNIEIGSPWLNLMRNSLNAQIWSFKHPNSLVVSATHGTAHLALFDQAMWDKYDLADRAGEKFKTNTLIIEPAAAHDEAADYEKANGVYSPSDNDIVTLQRRGVVFLACHNAIWEISGGLIAADKNPDKLTHEALASELTNHLIPGAILTPGIVATIAELQHAGFSYAK